VRVTVCFAAQSTLTCGVVFDSGKLELYERKRDYLDRKYAINEQPIFLKNYFLTLDVGCVMCNLCHAQVDGIRCDALMMQTV
jgi:hypothetical protein